MVIALKCRPLAFHVTTHLAASFLFSSPGQMNPLQREDTSHLADDWFTQIHSLSSFNGRGWRNTLQMTVWVKRWVFATWRWLVYILSPFTRWIESNYTHSQTHTHTIILNCKRCKVMLLPLKFTFFRFHPLLFLFSLFLLLLALLPFSLDLKRLLQLDKHTHIYI